MASIQTRKETGTLIIDFYYRGVRCREQTALTDSPTNRKRLQAFITKLDAAIARGSFAYSQFFPDSKLAARFEHGASVADTQPNSTQHTSNADSTAVAAVTPLFRDFAQTWYSEKEVEWRRSHRKVVRMDLDVRLIPRFGDTEVGRITKAEVLAFRAELGKAPARGKKTALSARRINKILNPLRQILNEAADRFNFPSPYQNIKQLKVRKTDVEPFTLDEVRRCLESVRADFRPYFTVRFFTGLRTGEVDGLKWKYIDFERRLILVRETVVNGEDEYTKTDGSQRDIQMSQIVHDALRAQEHATRAASEYVFCNRLGKPLDHKNVTNRVWYPLLRFLGLKERRPYQCRHTAATLWLASGESPEWIARQLGHTTTEMLFRVYSRYVPNLTRKDGSAFERLLTGTLGHAERQLASDTASLAADAAQVSTPCDALAPPPQPPPRARLALAMH